MVGLHSRRLLLATAAAMALAPRADAQTPATDLELVYVHDRGCPYCRAFDLKIAPIYGKTPEGAKAPIRQVEKGSPEFAAIRFARPARFTPTFVLMRAGEELGRIEGYPGEDFFFGLLGRLIDEASAKPKPAGG